MSGVKIAFPGSFSANRFSLPMSLTRVDYHSYSLLSRLPGAAVDTGGGLGSGGAQGGGGEGPPGLRVLRVRLAGSGCAWSAGIHADALDDTFFSLSTRYKDQQVTHTHTHRQRTNIPRHRHTRTRQEQHPKPPNEHLPQTLNNARRLVWGASPLLHGVTVCSVPCEPQRVVSAHSPRWRSRGGI